MAVNPYAVSSGSATGTASRTSSSSVSEREDLANFISMITRDETPFMSSIGKTKAEAVWHEWQTDSLAAPLDSSLNPGADYTEVNPDFGAGTGGFDDGARSENITPNRVRYGNRTQINGKTIAVSGTKRAVDQAGVADEYAYQLKKRGTELRRDLEFDLIHSYNVSGQTNATGIVGAGSGARTFGGFQAWINDPRTCIYASGNAVAAADAGTGRAVPTLALTTARSPLALSHIDQAMHTS